MRKRLIGTAALLMLAVSCQGPRSARRAVDVRPTEAWDSQNAPRTFGNLQTMRYQELVQEERRRGVLDQQPWSDDYWPWKQGGLANRWLMPEKKLDIDVDVPNYERQVRREIEAFTDFARRADDATRQRLSPMEKYDLVASEGFPLTTKELVNYARHRRYFEEMDIPWAWMGSCDGWALAALRVRAPRYPVQVATPGGKPVLLTVGDIRGLVSKLFTDNHKSKQPELLGTRCEQRPDAIVRDQHGRIVDGILGRWQGDAFARGRDIEIVYNNWRPAGYQAPDIAESLIVFRYRDEPGKLYWLEAAGWTDRVQEIARVEVRPLRDGQIDASVAAKEMDFRYLKACRDLNAGAFHIVLARLLSSAAQAQTDRAPGFAIEIERTNEVWNQPIYGYITRLGEPVDLQALAQGAAQDPYRRHRAPGTRYLVHAYTTIYFALGNGPLVIYGEDDNLLSYRTYQYTLELDENGYVIGGEWHPPVGQTAEQLTPLSGTALLAHIGEQRAYDPRVSAPDFLWRYPANTQILPTCNSAPCLSPAVISRLAACSRKQPRDRDTADIAGQTVPFVRCQL